MHITGAGGVVLNVEYSLADSVRPALKLNLKQHKTLFGRQCPSLLVSMTRGVEIPMRKMGGLVGNLGARGRIIHFGPSISVSEKVRSTTRIEA